MLDFSHVPGFSRILDWDEDGTIYNHFQLPETKPPPFLRKTIEYIATYTSSILEASFVISQMQPENAVRYTVAILLFAFGYACGKNKGYLE